MSLLVVGSVAVDSVETPAGSVPEALGGSASYFAYAASYLTPVRVVSVVGEDFPDSYLDTLRTRTGIDLSGIKKEPGKSFRWKGRYTGDMNVAETLEVHLNVFGSFDPDIPVHYRDSKYVFLANGSPVVQRKVLHQIKSPKLVVADTMNFWIETQRDELITLLREVDGLVLNDQEALLLTQDKQLAAAGMKIVDMGPRFVIVKKGEHGSMMFSQQGVFAFPAYPTLQLVDPTGAGDSFAGGMMGYIASVDNTDPMNFKRAMAYGTVAASVNVEDFSLRRFERTTVEDLDERFAKYKEMLRID